MVEREVVREQPVSERPVTEREIVVDDRPRGGGGGLIAAVVGIILVLIVGWFLLNALGVMNDAAEEGGIPSGEVEVQTNTDG
jgi:hypothetical protein